MKHTMNNPRKIRLNPNTFILLLLVWTLLLGACGRSESEAGGANSVADGGRITADGNGTSENGPGGENGSDGNGAAESEAPLIGAVAVEDERTITISAAGDCTLGTDRSFDYDTSFPAMYEYVGDPAWFFAEVKEAFEDDDLTIVNLEGPLTDRGERKDKTFSFRGKPSYVKVLTEGSVEAANLANNHSGDYGMDGYEDTKAVLEEAGITSFGYDRSRVISVNGVQVGLVGILELFEGYDSADLMLSEIDKVKEEGAELIIVSFHWGTEKEYYPDDIQQTLAHKAIDAGAHLILGHHPHVLQGIEVYKGRNIVYSLGNFCFGGNKNPSDKDTMIFQQTFTISEGLVSDDNERTIIPCSLSGHSSYNDYQPRILSGDEAERVREKIEELSF